MKRPIEGETRTQVTLLPDCLDDYVTEEIQSEWLIFSSMNSTWAPLVVRASILARRVVRPITQRCC